MLKLDQCISWPQETAISSSVWLPVSSHDSEAVALFLRITQTRIFGFVLALKPAAFYAQKYRPKLPPLQTWLWKSKFCFQGCFEAGFTSRDQKVGLLFWPSAISTTGQRPGCSFLEVLEAQVQVVGSFYFSFLLCECRRRRRRRREGTFCMTIPTSVCRFVLCHIGGCLCGRALSW